MQYFQLLRDNHQMLISTGSGISKSRNRKCNCGSCPSYHICGHLTLLVTNVPSVGRFNQLTTWIVTFQGIRCLHMPLKFILSRHFSELVLIPELEPIREFKQAVSKERVHCLTRSFERSAYL